MAPNPFLRETITRIAHRSESLIIRREIAREVISDSIADEIYSGTPEDADFDVLALTEMIVERLESLGVELPKPRIRVRATTRRLA